MASPDERQEPVTDEFEDEIHEVPSHTPDFRTELAEDLARLVPEAVADGRIDVEKLLELLDEDAARDGRERFGLMWPGKSRALKAAQAKTTATLVPDRENSKDWDTTQNVFIEGDNLEVLKILQKHYHGKIKLIYIDPPYNTGNDFIYPDNYREGLQTYLEWTKQVSEDGKKLSSNPESAGRYHSNWLNMMYPRLKLARNMLTDDGVIFISIDDHEIDNLQKMCREIFGENNVETIVWHKVGDDSGRLKITHRVRREHEYILACYRDVKKAFFNKYLAARNYKNTYTNPDGDPRGPYKQGIISHTEEKSRVGGKNFFEVTTPSGRIFARQWRFTKQEFQELDADGRIYYGKSGDSVPSLKVFINEQGETTPTTLISELGTAKSAGKALIELFGGKRYFDYPKPVGLLKRLMVIATDKDSIVMDFFAGSGTTAEAMMDLNAEDGGRRHFILVQLPEPTELDSLAREDEYATLAALTRERIRRAGQQTKEKPGNQLSTREIYLDIGFRAYKLSETSFVNLRGTSATDLNALEERLAGLRGSADDNATPEMLLTELLLKQGYSLTERVSETEIAGLRVWSVAEGAMLAIMDEHVKPSLEQLRAVVESGPVRLVILEDVFVGDDQLKTNLVQYAKTHGVELWSA